MPYSGLQEVLNETGTSSKSNATGSIVSQKEKDDKIDGKENSYGNVDSSYGDEVDDSDLSSNQPIFTAYQLSFIKNRLSSNQANLRAIIDIFRKFSNVDVDSMINEVYPNAL